MVKKKVYNEEYWKELTIKRIRRIEISVSFIVVILIIIIVKVMIITPQEISKTTTSLNNVENSVSSILESQNKIKNQLNHQKESKTLFDHSSKSLHEGQKFISEKNLVEAHKTQDFHGQIMDREGMSSVETAINNKAKNQAYISHASYESPADLYNDKHNAKIHFRHLAPSFAKKVNKFQRSSNIKPTSAETIDSRNLILQNISETRQGKLCDQSPILSPYNTLNNYTYDERVDRILSVLYGISPIETLSNQGSSRYKAACFILYDDSLQMEPNNSFFPERYALAVLLYEANVEDSVPVLMENPCNINGITCDESTGHMISVSHFKISSIPPEISMFQSLKILNLAGNNMRGTIPWTIGFLTHLEDINFERNSLTGMIPSEIGKLSALKTLNTDGNKLEGTIPNTIGQCTNLELLRLSNNQLDGAIPSQLFECTRLKELIIFDNLFSGTIPTSISVLQDLERLILFSNNFSGEIPSEIGSLRNIWWLSMFSNKFSGTLPREFKNLINIKNFWINHNLLTGTVPDIFEDFTQIEILDLSNNNFHGEIPSSMWKLHSIQSLYLHRTELEGTVPVEFCSNTTDLDLQVESVSWFDTPAVDNGCFNKSRVGGLIFEAENDRIRLACPDPNIYRIDFFSFLQIKDQDSNTLLTESFLFRPSTINLCLSLTGCYDIEHFISSDFTKDVYKLYYNSSTKSLIRYEEHEQPKCDTINICGKIISANDYERKIINHLTELVINKDLFQDSEENGMSPMHQALCLVLDDDKNIEYDVFDGTLLQRFVLATFFFENRLDFNHKVHTCEWKNITCDSTDTYVEEINLQDRDLKGSLITEIGFLERLRVINLRNNHVVGTIDPIIFANLRFLEKFDLSENNLEGFIPTALIELEHLHLANLANNKLSGFLPSEASYTKSLKTINVSNNLLQGRIPLELMKSENLESIDLSFNGFGGMIPQELCSLKNLRNIRFQVNNLVGSIPSMIFLLPAVEEISLQNNKLTGNIPTEMSNLNNIKHIVMNHNSLKGGIPEFGTMDHIETVRFHSNKLVGTAPRIDFNVKTDRYHYMTDCGDPAFLLSTQEPVECEDCSMCCDSFGRCQDQISTWFTEYTITLLSILFLLFPAVYFCYKWFPNALWIDIKAQPFHFDNSTYCFIFSKNITARCIYCSTVIIQFSLYLVYFLASRVDPKTDWQYSFRCSGDRETCYDLNEANSVMWLFFGLVILLFLGKDLVLSVIQFRMGLQSKNTWLVVSGIILGHLTLWSLFVSFLYNRATSENNTDLVTNTVILVFINGIDEAIFEVFSILMPAWTDSRLQEVQHHLAETLSKETDVIEDEY